VDLTAAIRTAMRKGGAAERKPLPVPRPGVLPKACLLLVLAIAQLALMLLHPMPARAEAPCPPSMAPIPGGR